MTSPATSSRQLSKFEKMTENAASEGTASNFSGTAGPNQLVGFSFYGHGVLLSQTDCQDSINEWEKPTNRARQANKHELLPLRLPWLVINYIHLSQTTTYVWCVTSKKVSNRSNTIETRCCRYWRQMKYRWAVANFRPSTKAIHLKIVNYTAIAMSNYLTVN